MKRKIILILLVFGFNLIWVNAISGVNNLAEDHNFVIQTTKKANLEKNDLMEDLDVLLKTDLSYQGEDAVVIGHKIDNYLNNKMKGKGEVISKYAINSNLNPYLVAAMIIEESGCDLECSFLVQKCNNVAKLHYDEKDLSQASCLGGSYQMFNSVEDSIRSYVNYVKTNFYDKELTTAEAIAKDYKRNVRWVFRINQKIELLKHATPLEPKTA